jgi:hypothetical protein
LIVPPDDAIVEMKFPGNFKISDVLSFLQGREILDRDKVYAICDGSNVIIDFDQTVESVTAPRDLFIIEPINVHLSSEFGQFHPDDLISVVKLRFLSESPEIELSLENGRIPPDDSRLQSIAKDLSLYFQSIAKRDVCSISVLFIDKSVHEYSFCGSTRIDKFFEFIGCEMKMNCNLFSLSDDGGPIDVQNKVCEIRGSVRVERLSRDIRVQVEFPDSGNREFVAPRRCRICDLRELILRDFPESFTLTDGNSELDSNIPLTDYAGRLVCRRIEAPNRAAEDQAVPIDVRRVDISELRPQGDSEAPKRTYRFIWGEEIADLEIANGQRVSEAKVVVADYWNSMTELITLLYHGKQLKDRMIISSLRIPHDGHIIVYIREMRSIYLRSCQDIGRQIGSALGGSVRAEPPDNYEELLDALVAATGEDRIMCMRCLKYFGYDFDRALSELQSNHD